MKYWITTHWPRYLGETDDYEGVYVQDGKQEAMTSLAKEHLVFVYETKFGPTSIESDGTRRRRQIGAEGIVSLVTVTADPEKGDWGPDRYENGKAIWWRWYAATENEDTGFVPRKRVAEILGYSPEYTFRGFGSLHSGLMEIRREDFEKLYADFVTTPVKPRRARRPPRRKPRSQRR
jgi:hypothetical protein